MLASGSIGNPAIVAYANQLAPTGNEGIAYAMISPGVGTILTVIAVQVVLAISAGAT